MEKKELGAAIIILILLGGVAALYFRGSEKNGGEEQGDARCSIDEDCVPANCCHAAACILASEKPDCPGVYCTAVCEPDTLDCGQGSCACVESKCKVILR